MSDAVVTRAVDTWLPTPWASFRLIAYDEPARGAVHLALVLGGVDDGAPVLARPHSECLTGDVFGSLRCDCQAQLHMAMRLIAEASRGVLLYLRQEGRGVGLANKLRAYQLQDQGLDTVEANLRLGLPVDERDYGVASRILADLGINRVRVLTNNPQKSAGLRAAGIEVVEEVGLVTEPTRQNAGYLDTKRQRLGHLLETARNQPGSGTT